MTEHRRHRELLELAFSDLESADALLRECPELLNSADPVGETALHHLVIENHLEAVRRFARRGAAVNTCDLSKQTPLHHAAKLGYADMLRLLLSLGADPCCADENGDSPLHEAAGSRKGGTAGVSLLLAAGAPRNVRNRIGETPLDVARRRGHAASASLLESHG